MAKGSGLQIAKLPQEQFTLLAAALARIIGRKS
jgi:hypothetical protein